MKTLRTWLVGLLVGLACTIVGGQVSAPTTIDIRDEGTSQGRVRAINFVGSSVVAAVSGSTATITVSSGGAGNFTEVSVNLGTDGNLVYTTTKTGEAWVTGTSKIVCTPNGTTSDGQTVETYFGADFSWIISNLVAGTGFDLTVYNPNGATGTFRFSCTGA